MNNPDTELLFPMRAIPNLADLRGEEWRDLVFRAADLTEEKIEKIAFSALIIKLAGCMGCTADSFRALRGCTLCSRLVIKRYKGNEEDLQRSYNETLVEVSKIIEKRKNLVITQEK